VRGRVVEDGQLAEELAGQELREHGVAPAGLGAPAQHEVHAVAALALAEDDVAGREALQPMTVGRGHAKRREDALAQPRPAQRALLLADRPQAAHQRAVLAEGLQQRVARDRQQPRVLQRPHAGVAVLAAAGQQRLLAEPLAGPQARQHHVGGVEAGGVDLHGARFEDEHAIAERTLAQQHLARLGGDDARLAGQPLELAPLEGGEERHGGESGQRFVAQHSHGDAVWRAA